MAGCPWFLDLVLANNNNNNNNRDGTKKIQNSFIQSIRIFVYGPFARLLLLLLLMMMMMVKVFFYILYFGAHYINDLNSITTNQPTKKKTNPKECWKTKNVEKSLHRLRMNHSFFLRQNKTKSIGCICVCVCGYCQNSWVYFLGFRNI